MTILKVSPRAAKLMDAVSRFSDHFGFPVPAIELESETMVSMINKAIEQNRPPDGWEPEEGRIPGTDLMMD